MKQGLKVTVRVLIYSNTNDRAVDELEILGLFPLTLWKFFLSIHPMSQINVWNLVRVELRDETQCTEELSCVTRRSVLKS